jgi:hypothetical protein
MVQFQNQKHEKPFIGSYTNIGSNGGNMIGRKYLIISTLAIFIALAMVGPVVAAPLTYSVSVSSYGSTTSLSQAKLSLLNDYSLNKPSISSLSEYSTLSPEKALALAAASTTSGLPATNTLSPAKTSALSGIFNGLTPSQGSVSAFSKLSQLTDYSELEFSQSISVSGDIYVFDFSTSFT